ncbi:MAG: hypothetical protein JXM72_10765, partial [Deltaproteobacteria bacterium]|nr:hypothetical protein [Deltaproteobacteria bacterium]
MSRRLYPDLPDHTLASIYQFLFGQLPEDIQMHRALNDARMAAEIWMKMTSDFCRNSLETGSKCT